MKSDLGFTKKQKSELSEIFTNLFNEVVLPGLKLLDVKRKLTDLENSTVEMTSYLGLKKRVEVLEYKVGIVI